MPANISPFAELALLLAFCTALGALFVRLRQPLLITYILAGVALGPAGLGLVRAHSSVQLFAQLGVTVLLFIVGLKLDLTHIRHIGSVALATGLGQLTFTIVIGFGMLLAMGRGVVESIYVAVALTFSSTIIIVKLLSDKREIDSLHGRIAVGFLVVQDLAVVAAMMVMSAMRNAGDQGTAQVLGAFALRVAAAAVITPVLMRWVIPRALSVIARSQELLLLFAVAWGVALAALGEAVGFSKEAGAFLAGFTLASTPYRDAMSARLSPLRDFLLLFFFIELGSGFNLASLGAELGTASALSLFVLVGNPLIVMCIMGYMGYRKRTGFLAGLTVAQISEFSIVFIAMGISLGHIQPRALGLTTLVGVVTITASTYMILYSHPLFDRLSPYLSRFERERPHRELAEDAHTAQDDAVELIVVGVGRYGHSILSRLRDAGAQALGVDADPEVTRALREAGWSVRFGDGEDGAFIETLPLRKAKLVVSTLPQWSVNRALFAGLRAAGFEGRIGVALREAVSEDELTSAGVDLVLRPFDDAADHAAQHILRVARPSHVDSAHG
jgi:Kef-type K+ transport system membrane component KefB